MNEPCGEIRRGFKLLESKPRAASFGAARSLCVNQKFSRFFLFCWFCWFLFCWLFCLFCWLFCWLFWFCWLFCLLFSILAFLSWKCYLVKCLLRHFSWTLGSFLLCHIDAVNTYWQKIFLMIQLLPKIFIVGGALWFIIFPEREIQNMRLKSLP